VIASAHGRMPGFSGDVAVRRGPVGRLCAAPVLLTELAEWTPWFEERAACGGSRSLLNWPVSGERP
jgi:hypothetical protein